jgi:dihydroorotate dehydrogenase electron transfer subunit
MNKTTGIFKVDSNIQLNYNTFLIDFKSDIALDDIKPGQFVNIQVVDSQSTFLRRPFSIFDVDYSKNSLKVLIKIAGKGSEKLTKLSIGDEIDMIFPLGNSFTPVRKGERVLLIGGGVGIAPLYYFAREMNKHGIVPDIILGARSSNDHVLIQEFKEFGSVHITSDDGSIGEKGFVTQHSIFSGDGNFHRIYCCGPEPMMIAVAKKAKILNIDCEVSLENMMACGFGVCLCCVTKTSEGNKCVCTEGPVFNINQLTWQI